jgi:SAM-dependent methyltransferase
MLPKHLEELIRVEQGYWWHVAKRALVVELLRRYFPPPARLVEGGIGGGGNLLALHDMGYQVAGFDLMPEAVEHCRQLRPIDVRQHNLQEPWPLEPGTADVVLMLDVIEHTALPVQVLKNAAKILRPRGGVIVTVPAYPWLQGPWDEMLGHYRRYTGRVLRQQAREAGLKTAWLSHWNSFTLPAAVAVRLAEKMLGHKRSAEFPQVSPRVNGLLKGCAGAERSWLRRIPLPVGLSLVGVLMS